MFERYDRKYLVRCVVTFLVVMLAMKFTHGVGFAIIIPLIFSALGTRRNEDLLFYLMLTGTIVVGNTFFFPKSMGFFMVQRGIIAVLGLLLGLKVFGRRIPPALKPVVFLGIYVGYMVISSTFGWAPLVSYLKIFLFGLCMFAYVGVISHILESPHLHLAKLRSILLAFGIVYILGSFAVVPFPGISQLTGEDYMNAIAAGKQVTSLFTGMTNQSQCLGPVVSMISTFLLADLLFSIRRWDKLYVLLLTICPFLIYKTSSRTAMGTFLIGVMVVVYFFMKARGITSQWRSRALSVLFAIGLLTALTLCSSSGVRQGAMKFLLKWGDQTADVSTESLVSSRQGLMNSAMYNFKKSPLFGNGFQVSAEQSRLKINSIKDALSAPIEKGVWVTAVLEEGGIIGFALFMIFILASWVILSRCHAYIGCSLLITFLASNLGEFTFFSMSYLGGFMWAMVFMGLAFDSVRNRDRMLEQQKNLPPYAIFPPTIPFTR